MNPEPKTPSLSVEGRELLARDISDGCDTDVGEWDDCLVMADHLIAQGWVKSADAAVRQEALVRAIKLEWPGISTKRAVRFAGRIPALQALGTEEGGNPGGLLDTIREVREGIASGYQNYGFCHDRLPDLLLWLECAAVGRTLALPAPPEALGGKS